jgi:hypothetical protein
MTSLFKKITVILLVSVLVGTFGFGCGGGGGSGKITITIGEMTDLTGPASPALIPLHYAVQDLVRYYNEEGLIPGVKLKLVTYDTQWNPARDIPGYDWLRSQGAKLIITVPSTTALTLKPFLERDKIVVASLTTYPAVYEPPGWAFCFSASSYTETETFLKWVSEHNWDYDQGIPKLGMIGAADPTMVDVDKAIKKYVQDHPGQFDYVGGYMPPIGTTLFSGEVESLKKCDYILTQGTESADFINQFLSKGYHTTFINVGDAASWVGMWADKCGWQALNGLLTACSSLSWDQSTPLVNLAKELLLKFHPGQANSIIYSGSDYAGGCQETVSILDILGAAVEQVGAANLDAQSFYDAATEYKTGGSTWEGYPEWSFSETKRYLVDDVVIYQFSAEAKEIVKISDWVPLVIE